MIDLICDAIDDLFSSIGGVISWIINGIMSMWEHVVGYFRGLNLRQGRDIPFVADQNKLADLIHSAPQKNVGIFEGTFNEYTNEIENYRSVEADEMDADMKRLIGREKLVVLS